MRKNRSILILTLLLAVARSPADVRDVVIFTDGNAATGLVTAITRDSLAYLLPAASETTVVHLDRVYYAYDDFGKILYYSRSLLERFEQLEYYGGSLYTLDGDTIVYQQIFFDRRMSDPLVYLAQSDTAPPLRVPFLEVASVCMSSEHYAVAVRRGCLSGTGLILALSSVGTLKYFKQNYPGAGLFSASTASALGEATWSSVTDFLPEADFLGIATTGPYFKLAVLSFPAAIGGWMAYDWYFDRRAQYINPGFSNRPFPRDMFIFSVREWSDVRARRVWSPVSRTVLEQTYKLRCVTAKVRSGVRAQLCKIKTQIKKIRLFKRRRSAK